MQTRPVFSIGSRSWLRRVIAAVAAGPLLVLALTSPAAALTVQRVDVGRTDAAVFLMEGAFEPGDTLRLQREIAKLPATMPVAVILNSGGGSLDEGLDLGRFFHSVRITTFSMGYGGVCLSACSLAFLGGRDRVTGKPARIKMTGGRLGFHQYRINWNEEVKKKVFKKKDIDEMDLDTRNTIYKIVTYLSDIGEDMSKLHLFLKAPAADMNDVSPEDAPKLGIHLMQDNGREVIESTNIRERVLGR
jgi:hypothetical protein